MRKKYSEEDDIRIIEMVEKGMKHWEMGEVIGRTKRAIDGRVKQLIKKDKLKPKIIRGSIQVIINSLMKFDSVQTWFTNIIEQKDRLSYHTKRKYLCFLDDFLKFHGINNPDKIIEKYEEVRYKPEQQRQKVLDEYTKMLKLYLKELSNKGRKRITIALKVGSFCSFMTNNNIPFKYKTPKIHDKKRQNERLPTYEELDLMLKHMDLRLKSIILFCIQSGLRITTVLNLRYRHIKEDFEKGECLCRVDIPLELITEDQYLSKGGYLEHWTCIGFDATKYLRMYLNERRNGTLGYIMRGREYIPSKTKEEINDDSLLFRQYKNNRPLNSSEANTPFVYLALRLGIYSRTEKRFTIHTLRKYFESKCVDTDSDWIQFFSGHTFKGMKKVYELFNDESMYEVGKDEYAKSLCVLSFDEDFKKALEPIINEIEEKKKERDLKVKLFLDEQRGRQS